jgi:hypothetical protein
MSRSRSPVPSRGFSAEGLSIMRNRWREVAELARRRAREALDGAAPSTVAETELALQLRRISTAALPVEGVSGQHMRTAFVEACQALLIAGETRAVAAQLTIAAAEAVLELLDLQARKLAAGWQRQFRD